MLVLISAFIASVASGPNPGVNDTFGEPENITPKFVENPQRLPGFTALPQPSPIYGATLFSKETLAFNDVSTVVLL